VRCSVSYKKCISVLLQSLGILHVVIARGYSTSKIISGSGCG
jgi:hypothetical protein